VLSFGATVVGKMQTAGLKGEPLAEIPPEIRKEWLETLGSALGAYAEIGLGLSQAMNTLKALESEISHSPVNLPVGPSASQAGGLLVGADRTGSVIGSG